MIEVWVAETGRHLKIFDSEDAAKAWISTAPPGLQERAKIWNMMEPEKAS